MNKEEKYCPYCGAPVYSNICSYCNSQIVKEEQTIQNEITTETTIDNEHRYPVMECKEVNFSFLTIGFPLIFGIGFFIGGFMMATVSFIPDEVRSEIMPMLTPFIFSSLLFFIIGLVGIYIGLIPIIRKSKINRLGSDVTGTVIEYEDDPTLFINDRPAQIVLIEAQTQEGTRLIRYQLRSLDKKYEIGSIVELKIYNEYMMIK